MKYKRPIGSTMLAINLRKNPNENNHSEMIKYICKQYVSNGFRLNNDPIELNDLAYYLNITPKRLIKEISRMNSMYFKVEDKDMVRDGLGYVVSKLLETTMRDRNEVEENTARLLGELGWGKYGEHNKVGLKGKTRKLYQPFVSGELTKALTLNISSQASLHNLANLLMKLGSVGPINNQPTINIQNNVQANQTNHDTTNLLTTEAAIHLLGEAKNHMVLAPGMDKVLEAEYMDEAVPDINPNTQHGYGSDRSIVLVKGRDNVKAHDERREAQLGEIVQ
jgi:hypothetical protein